MFREFHQFNIDRQSFDKSEQKTMFLCSLIMSELEVFWLIFHVENVKLNFFYLKCTFSHRSTAVSWVFFMSTVILISLKTNVTYEMFVSDFLLVNEIEIRCVFFLQREHVVKNQSWHNRWFRFRSKWYFVRSSWTSTDDNALWWPVRQSRERNDKWCSMCSLFPTWKKAFLQSNTFKVKITAHESFHSKIEIVSVIVRIYGP